MKAYKSIIILVFIIIGGFSTMSAQSKKEKRAAKEKFVRESVIAESYKIDVTTAYPRNGKSVQLSTPYSLEIRNDSVISYLPFYGRAYNIPYGGGNGLVFRTRLDEYEMKTDSKGAMKVKFTARTNEDKYTFRLHIFSNGTTNIDVNMQNRNSMSFHGEIAEK